MAALKILGKFLISVGVGVLLFVAWTLWGTGISTGRAQERLATEYARVSFNPGEPGGQVATGPPESFRPGPGDPVFRIRIPELDVTQMVVEGVDVEQLKLGPGHYPDCRDGFEKPLCTPVSEVWPGESGRVIVSGHRTTYGAPFWALDKLRAGDDIEVESAWGDFTYVVERTEVVAPDNTSIANPVSKVPELVLTTCNPRFSASERLVVYAELTR